MSGYNTASAPPNGPEVSRDVDLWFFDGNIVVVAGRTSFRVHQSVLARHSVVFENMFGIPQLADSTDLIDNCPVVRMSDSTSDIKHLLYMLYDGFSYLRRDGPRCKLSVLLALVRMGNKYECDGVVDAVDDHLDSFNTFFPSSLADFHDWTSAGAIKLLMYSQPCVEGFELGHPIEAINLFRLLSPRRDHMLPTAFYLASTLGPSTLLLGPDEFPTAERLSLADAVVTLEAHIELLKSHSKLATIIFSTEGNCCGSVDSPGCIETFNFVQRHWTMNLGFDGDPFRVDDLGVNGILTQLGFDCAMCAAMVESRVQMARKEIWGRLPEITKVDVAEWEDDPEI